MNTLRKFLMSILAVAYLDMCFTKSILAVGLRCFSISQTPKFLIFSFCKDLPFYGLDQYALSSMNFTALSISSASPSISMVNMPVSFVTFAVLILPTIPSLLPSLTSVSSPCLHWLCPLWFHLLQVISSYHTKALLKS